MATKPEEEAKRIAEEARKRKAEEEQKKREEEARRKKAEEEQKKREEEARKKKAEEEQRQREADAKRKAEEEQKQREEEAKRKAEAEHKQREEEARKKAEEKARRKEEARKKKAEEEARKAAEEEARKKKEEEQRQREEEAKRKAEAEHKQREEEARRKAEQELKQREEDARKRAEEQQQREVKERRKKAKVEARIREQEARAVEQSNYKELEIKLRLVQQRNEELMNENRSRMRVTEDKASKYPIYRLFRQPSPVWITELQRGQAAAYRRLLDAGSKQQLPPLIGRSGKVEVPPGKTVAQLDQAAFCGFFKGLLSDDDAVATLAQRVKVVRDPTAPADAVNIAVNELSATLRLTQKPIVVIVCGHEKSGKTTTVECTIGLRLGFTQAERATVCPVVYIIEKPNAPDDPNDMHCWLGTSVEEVQKGSQKRSISDLAGLVEVHMMKIIGTQDGYDLAPLYVRIVASCANFVGWLVDTPGTLPTAEGANETEDSAFLQGVKNIIAQRVADADPENSVILCVESRRNAYVNGGLGQFYAGVLSKVRGFESFKHRVTIVFNHNDAHFESNSKNDPELPWLLGNWRAKQAESETLKAYCNKIKSEFFKQGPRPDVFFTSLIGVGTPGGVYKSIQRNQGENLAAYLRRMSEARKRTLDEHSSGIAAAFKAQFPDLANIFESDRSFLFSSLLRHINTTLQKSSHAIREQITAALDEIDAAACKHLDSVRIAAMDESKRENSALVFDASTRLLSAFTTFGNEYNRFLHGWPHMNLRFDKDDYSRGHIAKWPFQCNYDWPARFHAEEAGQTLARFLQIKHFTLDCPNYDELENLLKSHIDAWDINTLNLATSYNAMIDGLFFRLAAVQLKLIREDQFYAALHGGMHTLGEDHSAHQAAFHKAMEALELLYQQFFSLLEVILVHFLQQAVEVAIMWMRCDRAFNHEPCPIAKHEAPLATLRHVMNEAIARWVRSQIPRRLPDFSSTGEEHLQKSYHEFAVHLNQLHDVDTKVGYGDCAALRNFLFSTLDKHNRKQFRAGKTTVAVQFNLAGEKPLDYAIKMFALQHQRYLRYFYNDWRYVKFNLIFGNPNDTDRSDHLKTMLSLFAQQAPMEMKATDFTAPLLPGHQSHATSVLFVDPLEKQDLEEYLRHLYGISDDVVRGSLRRKELLEKTRELLSGAQRPQAQTGQVNAQARLPVA